MNVYRFKINKSIRFGNGEAIVAANNKNEAWSALKKELGVYSDFFDERRCDRIWELTCLLSEPNVITHSFYVE